MGLDFGFHKWLETKTQKLLSLTNARLSGNRCGWHKF